MVTKVIIDPWTFPYLRIFWKFTLKIYHVDMLPVHNYILLQYQFPEEVSLLYIYVNLTEIIVSHCILPDISLHYSYNKTVISAELALQVHNPEVQIPEVVPGYIVDITDCLLYTTKVSAGDRGGVGGNCWLGSKWQLIPDGWNYILTFHLHRLKMHTRPKFEALPARRFY